jgi:bifunctional NMN adenylyltransferase/nudix hydrolase
MGMIKTNEYTTGVVVGRFQVQKLHEGHRELLDWVNANHDTMIVMLGCPPVSSRKNPLGFVVRRAMIVEQYPNAIVLPIHDQRTDGIWSDDLDAAIRGVIRPADTVCLYGSRDGFIGSYCGMYPTQELVASNPHQSGTKTRSTAEHKAGATEDFRSGMIYAQNGEYPRSIPTVDVAVFTNDEKNAVYMVRKNGEDRFRFPGGYVEPGRTHAEMVRKEVCEEVGDVEIDDIQPVGDTPIDDWRYADGPDNIHTTFYTAMRVFGAAKPKDTDEIAEVREFTLTNLYLGYENSIVPEHHVLVQMLRKATGHCEDRLASLGVKMGGLEK